MSGYARHRSRPAEHAQGPPSFVAASWGKSGVIRTETRGTLSGSVRWTLASRGVGASRLGGVFWVVQRCEGPEYCRDRQIAARFLHRLLQPAQNGHLARERFDLVLN